VIRHFVVVFMARQAAIERPQPVFPPIDAIADVNA
jgi:hypothetical protein